MEKHSCKLCFRSFVNGRALGGHMRSHVAAATKPTATSSASSESFSSSRAAAHDDDINAAKTDAFTGYGLRENPKKRFLISDPELGIGSSAFLVHEDRESESESFTPKTHRRRSKRARPDPAEPEPVSSVSDAIIEEDVALSLMMLSRDVWNPIGIEEEAEAAEDDFDLDESRITKSKKSKYQCGTCKKSFKSYQALGGHRASHKKTNGCISSTTSVRTVDQVQLPDANVDDKVSAQHQCPICYRVFSSGQALGGHKRSHLASSATTTATITITTSNPKNWIDLNLPAPMEDDAEVEVSAVSDAEFVARA